jgi:PAS domain S-box-containing protein
MDENKKLTGSIAQQKQDSWYARSLIEASLDPLVTISPSGKITDVNKATTTVTGLDRETLIGTDFSDYFTDQDKAQEGYKQVFANGSVTDYPLTIRHTDGRLIDVLYHASLYRDAKGEVLGVFAAARDVTESNRLAQILVEKNTDLMISTAELKFAKTLAEDANLAKSEFLFSMSHELRTPLNAILGFAQLMESDSPPPNPNQRDGIEQILKAGWHLLTLINEILDLTKVESGEVPLSQESVSLATVMFEARRMIEPQSLSANIAITFPPVDMNFYIHADHTRVKQVLINLLSNAIKYNRQKGIVEVSCTEITSDRIRISVRDTGAGLSPEDQAQLFQPFNRLGKEVGSQEGSGIGLVVCKQLVELMNGSIGMESKQGEGSLFWFELPLVSEPHLTKTDGPVVVSQQSIKKPHLIRPYTLLYIEDNPANLKLFEKIMERYPRIQLQTAINGTDGVALALKLLPDVIVTDINMSDLNGFDVLKILGSHSTTAVIPIIALSANAMPEDVTRGLKAGFFRYLTKPIKIDEFMEAQDSVLEFIEEQTSERNKDSKL